MNTRSTVLFTTFLLLAGCSPSIATFGEPVPPVAATPAQRPPVRQTPVAETAPPAEQEPTERFDNYNDDAADSFLTRQVNKRLEREMLEERRRQQEAEMLRLRAQAQSRQQTPVREESVRARSPGHYVPWNTLLWSGLGAAIGSHNGKSGEGAAIGAGFGLLLDAARWW